MKTVAHFMPYYLGISETFIYEFITNLRAYRPIVLAKKTGNLDLFPISGLYTSSSIPRFSWWWLVNGLRYRLTNRDEFFEHMSYFKHILKKSRARLIHAHFGPAGVDMLLLKRTLNLPMVTTFYGFDMSNLPKVEKWANSYEKLFAEGDLFLVEGNNMKNGLIELGCPQEKIRIQHIGIDVTKFPFKARRLKNDEDKITLLFCGRFTEKKGLIYALKAVKAAAEKCPAIEFRVIGDGELKTELLDFIDKNEMSRYVTFLGYQPHSVYAREIQKAHILIQPSVTAANGDSEGGAPTVLLEAQACGLPVLSTYHADIPEVVKDGKSGFLLPERDSTALADKLIYLIENPQLWPDMGKAGRRHVEKNHNIRKEIEKLESLYDELLGSG